MKPKFRFASLFASSIALCASFNSVHAASGDWTSLIAGNWSDAANWSTNPTVPGTVAGDVVSINSNIAGASIVTIDTTSRTVGTLNIGDFDNTHGFTLASTGSATLTFNNSGSGASIVETGSVADTLDSTLAVILADNLGVNSAGALTIAGTISQTGGARSITKSGAGTLTLSNALNSYSGGTIITGGILEVENGDGSLGNIAGSITLNGGRFSSNASFTTGRDVVVGVNGGEIKNSASNSGFSTSGKLSGSGTLTLGDPGGASQKNYTFSSLANDFTGGIVINKGVASGAIALTLSKLNDSSNHIAFNSTGGSITFNYAAAADSDLNLANRVFEVNGGSDFTTTINNLNATYGITIAKDLVATGAGVKTLFLNAASGPSNAFNGNITDGSDGGKVAITKSGSGTWTLGGTNNTFSGTIASSGNAGAIGTLAYASAGGSNPISVTQNTGSFKLSYIGSGSQTMSGAITANALTTGTVTFDSSGSGAVNYSNTASIGSSISTGQRKIVFSGTSTGENKFAGGIVNNTGTGGTAQVTKNGTGTWILTGTNTYTAGTSVTQGTLVFGKVASKATGGTHVFNAGTTLGLGVATSDSNYFNASDVTSAFGTGTILSNVTVTATTNVAVDTTAGNFSYTAGYAGNPTKSLTKLGINTLTLEGTNTYTGATTVSAGALIVNGNISTSVLTTVAATATLGGTGTVGAATIDGILAPGNSIGTLTALGDVTWNDNDAWVFELGSAVSTLALANTTPGLSDLLDITGGNDFLKGTGSSFSFDFAGGGTAGWYKLVDWTGSTTFAGTDFLAANLDTGLSGAFTVDSGTSALYLNVVAVPEPGATLLGGLGFLLILRRRR